MFKYLLFGFLGLLIFFSGCVTTTQDLEKIVLANSVVDSFKKDHPNAEFNAVLWSISDFQTNSNKVLALCGKNFDSEYYYFTLKENKDIIEGFLDKNTFDLVCVKNYNLDSDNSLNVEENTNNAVNPKLLDDSNYNLTIKSSYNQGNMTNVPYVLFSSMCDLDNVFKLMYLAQEKRSFALENNSNVDVAWDVESNLGLNREYLDIDEGEGNCEFVYYYYFNPDNKIMKSLPKGKYVLGIFKDPVWFSEEFTTSSYSLNSTDYGLINSDYDKITALEFELNSNKEINIAINNVNINEEFSATIKVEGRNDWGTFPENSEVSLITQDGQILETKKLVDKKAEFTITNKTPPFVIRSENGAIAPMNPDEGYGSPVRYGWRYHKLIKLDNDLYLERIDDGAVMKVSYSYLLYVIKPGLIVDSNYNLTIESSYNKGNMTNVPYVLFSDMCDLDNVFKLMHLAQEKRSLALENNSNVDVAWDVESNLGLNREYLDIDEGEGNCEFVYYYYFNPDNKIMKSLPKGKYVLGIFKDKDELVSTDYGLINSDYDKITALEFELNSNKEINIAVEIN